MEFVECVVVGAGVIGLAVARALAQRGYETLVVEAERVTGSGMSSRNSEVIHAGIYYPPGSLKARLCVTGRDELYGFCDARQIAYRRCGKLIVATTTEQIPELVRLNANAQANGVRDIRMLSRAEVAALEPELSCVAALESAATGIIDSHSYMLALGADAEAAGATFVLGTEVAGLEPVGPDVALQFRGEPVTSLRARLVVNAAGLGAVPLANAFAQRSGRPVRPLFYAKGSYFSLGGRAPVTRLVYPVPEAHGLGTHLTLDLAGRARFGPDVEWIAQPQFEVDPQRARNFYPAIRTYWPALPDGALMPAYAGVRPKLSPPAAAAADFLIETPAGLGAGLINLLGIESPGLTSSLALAAQVAREASQFLAR